MGGSDGAAAAEGGMGGPRHPPARSRTEGLPQGLEGTTCERRRELNLHRREASCLQGDVIAGYKYLQGNNGDRGGELFTGARWQDTERARPGRGEPVPWGHPEVEPSRGARGQPGPGHPTCQQLPGRGARAPAGRPSLALPSPEVPPASHGHSRWPARAIPCHVLGTGLPGWLLEGQGWPGWGCSCQAGRGGQVQRPPSQPCLCKRGWQRGDGNEVTATR